MSIETPTAIWFISHLANSKVNIAGFLIFGAISIWIESPVIDLLATATTLAKTRQSFLQIRHFAIWMIVWVTVAHTLVSTTPLFYFLTRDLIGVKEEIIQAIHLPLILMIPWSGFIGWRRYLQGLMIRNGQTWAIGVGTFVRFGTMATVGFVLYLGSKTLHLGGLEVAAIALVTSVAAESMYIHFVSRRVIHRAFSEEVPAETNLSLGTIGLFHLPLTLATMVTIMSGLIVGGALAKTPDSVTAMAAWQVGTILTFMFRTITYALNEVVISLSTDDQARRKLLQFCLMVGLGTSVAAIICGLSGFDYYFFNVFLSVKPEIVPSAHIALLAVAATPFLTALLSYFRGLLTSKHVTLARFAAIIMSVLTLTLSLVVGINNQWPGVAVAAGSITLAMCVELTVLGLFWRARMRADYSNDLATAFLLHGFQFENEWLGEPAFLSEGEDTL